jgi:hypothetical protein
MIYFVQPARGGLVKIGVAVDPEKRMRDLQCGSPLELRLIRVEEGERDRERELHEKFSSLQVRGEWFYPAESLATYSGAIPADDPDIAALIESAYGTGFTDGLVDAETSFGRGDALRYLESVVERLAPYADEGVSFMFDRDPDWVPSDAETDLRAAARALALFLASHAIGYEGIRASVRAIWPKAAAA